MSTNSTIISNSSPWLIGSAISTGSPSVINSSWTNNLTVSLDDWDVKDYHQDVKKYEVFESPEDVLALSVTWKRMRDSNTSSTGKLLDAILFKNVTDADRAVANNIREYYSKKFMMSVLVSDGKPPSEFRKEITKVINGDGRLITKAGFGPVYFLPIFYEYDCNLDYVKSRVKINQQFTENGRHRRATVVKDTALTRLTKILKKNRNSTMFEFWFMDDIDESANVISIAKDNPLLNVWDYIFSTNEVLKINGQYETKRIDNFEYFLIKNWNLSKD